VKLYIGYGRYYETSVADFVVVSFVLGVIISIIMSFFYDLKKALSGWREEKKERRKEEFKDLFEKAKSYDLRGDREKAIENVNRVIRRAPDIEEPYIFLSDLYSSMKEFDKATEVLDLAETNIGKRESILLKKVNAYRAKKDMQKGVKGDTW
jgi:tetratricopeptide (TPR) repeat protein